MKDVRANDTTSSGSDSKGPTREASTATDEDVERLVYGRAHFRKDKIRQSFNLYYIKRRVIIDRGVEVVVFDEHIPRVRAVLKAQGWTNMVKDHHPAIEEIVREFYVNLHQRVGDSFWSWIRRRVIKVIDECQILHIWAL